MVATLTRFVVVLVVAVGAAGAQAELAAAKRLYDRGDYDKALAAYRAKASGDTAIAARVGEGRCQLALGRVREALEVLEAVANEDGAGPDALVALAEALHASAELAGQDKLFRLQQLEDALAKCAAALERDATFAAAHRVRSRVERSKGQVDDALVSAGKAVELDPAEGDNHLELGHVHAARAARSAAADAYEAAAKAYPKVRATPRRDAYLWAAFTHDQNGAPERAADAYLNSFAIDPSNAALYNGLWQLYSANEAKKRAAVELLERFVKKDSRAAYPHYYLGYFHNALGDGKAARAAFKRAVKTPEGAKWAAAWGALAEACLTANDEKAAERAAFKGLAIDANDATCTLNTQRLVSRAVEKRDSKRAIELTKRLLEYQPKNAQEWSKLAGFYHMRRQLRDAEPFYEKALALDPNDPQIKANAANLYNDTNRGEIAERLWLEALEIDPKHVQSLRNLGYWYRKIGKTDAARDCFQRAADLGDNASARALGTVRGGGR